jgi:hypothetical protein
MSKGVIWLQWILLMTVPMAAVVAAPFVEARRPKADSLSVVEVLLLALALFLLVAPFIVEFLLRMSRQPLPQGADLPRLLLLIGVGGSSTVSFMGLLTVSLGGAFSPPVYGWIAISVVSMLFYSWRYRRALA